MSDLGNKEIFSQNLKYYMTKKNKTRNDICSDLGFRYTTFVDWENAKNYPRIDKIEMLSNYFGIKKSDLIEKHNPALNRENETDITKMIDDLKVRLSTPKLTFKGKLVTEEEKQALINGMQIALQIALQKNK